MEDFVYQGFAARVLFGNGAAKRLGEELDRLSIDRAMILCSPGRAGLAGERIESVQEIDLDTVDEGVIFDV